MLVLGRVRGKVHPGTTRTSLVSITCSYDVPPIDRSVSPPSNSAADVQNRVISCCGRYLVLLDKCHKCSGELVELLLGLGLHSLQLTSASSYSRKPMHAVSFSEHVGLIVRKKLDTR